MGTSILKEKPDAKLRANATSFYIDKKFETMKEAANSHLVVDLDIQHNGSKSIDIQNKSDHAKSRMKEVQRDVPEEKINNVKKLPNPFELPVVKGVNSGNDKIKSKLSCAEIEICEE